MIVLLHGPDELLRWERLASLRAALGPAELADLSTSWLDGHKTPVSEVCYTCDVVPFLTPRRLVIVEGLLTRLGRQVSDSSEEPAGDGTQPGAGRKQELDELLAYLPALPETSDLALVETTSLGKRHPVYKLVAQLARQGQAEVVECEPPSQRDLPGWIVRRVRSKGAAIEPAAAQDLAVYVGRNLRLLDSELDKLIAYRSDEGSITRQDVRLLVPYTQEANIFDMVDAIGRRDGATALRLLRELERDGAAPLYLLAMIVRQFRILIQVAEQMAQGLDKEAISRAIGLHPYPTQKAMQQSQRWPIADLEAAYDRLLDADLAIKTGKMPDELALDLLVIDLSRRPSS